MRLCIERCKQQFVSTHQTNPFPPTQFTQEIKTFHRISESIINVFHFFSSLKPRKRIAQLPRNTSSARIFYRPSRSEKALHHFSWWMYVNELKFNIFISALRLLLAALCVRCLPKRMSLTIKQPISHTSAVWVKNLLLWKSTLDFAGVWMASCFHANSFTLSIIRTILTKSLLKLATIDESSSTKWLIVFPLFIISILSTPTLKTFEWKGPGASAEWKDFHHPPAAVFC